MPQQLAHVALLVRDYDEALAYFAGRLGFAVDHDIRIGEGRRVVQLTPPGSGCSIVIGEGVVPEMPPGSLRGLQLVIADIVAAHAQLVERGVEVGEVTAVDGDAAKAAAGGAALDNVGFVFFADPDGNGWAVQQISARG